MNKQILLLAIIALIFTTGFAQNTIDISVKGISDSKNDGAQQDRLEAILDAKIQACEKAGLSIQAKSVRENFQITYDFVETQAETVLMPGFQIIDIGYVQDGTYQIVLVGKIADEDKSSDSCYVIITTDFCGEEISGESNFFELLDWFNIKGCSACFKINGESIQYFEEQDLEVWLSKVAFLRSRRAWFAVLKYRIPVGKLEIARDRYSKYYEYKKRVEKDRIYLVKHNFYHFTAPREFLGTINFSYSTGYYGKEEKLIFPNDFTKLTK